mmetsp:Transcript_35856/g.76504  ORF Transcript_35856/g.76504 Transcript_35856/m.76504 type:complete len:286 (-) Transcript_35856:289-1146(-)
MPGSTGIPAAPARPAAFKIEPRSRPRSPPMQREGTKRPAGVMAPKVAAVCRNRSVATPSNRRNRSKVAPASVSLQRPAGSIRWASHRPNNERIASFWDMRVIPCWKFVRAESAASTTISNTRPSMEIFLNKPLSWLSQARGQNQQGRPEDSATKRARWTDSLALTKAPPSTPPMTPKTQKGIASHGAQACLYSTSKSVTRCVFVRSSHFKARAATTAETKVQSIVEYLSPVGEVVPSSSIENNTPPRGAPKAAETPAAAPMQVKSVSLSTSESPGNTPKRRPAAN